MMVVSFKSYSSRRKVEVPWLDSLPKEWTLAPMKYHFMVVGGSTPKSGEEAYWDGNVVWVTPADLSKLSTKYVNASARSITKKGLDSCGASFVPENSVIVSSRAPIGSLAIAALTLCTNQGCKALVPLSNHSDSRYLYYWLSVNSEQLNVLGKGTTFLEISGEVLAGFHMPVPSFVEQETISTFLDHETAKIDTLIDKQQQLIKLLKEKRQAVISHAVTKGLDSVAPMKDSGVEWLGEVPEHWKVLRVGILFSESGARAESETELEYPILRVSIHHGISDKELDEEEMDRKVSRSEDRSLYKVVGENDLAYNMMRAWQGGFGAAKVNGLISPAYVVCKPKSALNSSFFELVLRTSTAVTELKRFSRGITDFRLRLYWDEFKNIQVPVPPEEDLDEILRHIETVNTRYDHIAERASKQIELLQERRTALISAAVTGKIDVRNLNSEQDEEAEGRSAIQLAIAAT
jgi:type I restriction enzyme S subunit